MGEREKQIALARKYDPGITDEIWEEANMSYEQRMKLYARRQRQIDVVRGAREPDDEIDEKGRIREHVNKSRDALARSKPDAQAREDGT